MKENLLTGHILFQAMKRITVINVSSNLIVKFNFVLPLLKLAIDALLINESHHTNDFYLVIEYHKFGFSTLHKYTAC